MIRANAHSSDQVNSLCRTIASLSCLKRHSCTCYTTHDICIPLHFNMIVDHIGTIWHQFDMLFRCDDYQCIANDMLNYLVYYTVFEHVVGTTTMVHFFLRTEQVGQVLRCTAYRSSLRE